MLYLALSVGRFRFPILIIIFECVREKAEKEAAREGANEAAREREQKETAIRTVDELRRAATKQEEAYDALVRTREIRLSPEACPFVFTSPSAS